VGLESVNRMAQLSSKLGDGFKKNQFRALYTVRTAYVCGRISKVGAFWDMIWHYAIFVGQIFQVFLWRDIRKNIWGNYLLTKLNFIPARKFAISLYFSSYKNAVSDRNFRLKICKLKVAISRNFCYKSFSRIFGTKMFQNFIFLISVGIREYFVIM